MSTFNSQEINTDPQPYVQTLGIARMRSSLGHDGTHDHRPRPEFDNSPNPILVDFRTARESEPEYTADPLDWLDTAWSDMDSTAAHEHEGWTIDHFNHARKVLTRLAALSES